MLDPNRHTRATISDILSHPWVRPQLRKISLEPRRRRARRVGVCNSQSVANDIASKLIASRMAQCGCSCHLNLRIGRDSAFIEHCEECESISPIPRPDQLPSLSQPRKGGTLSTSSSGYASSDSLTSYFTPTKDTCDTFCKDTLCSPSEDKKLVSPVPMLDNKDLVYI